MKNRKLIYNKVIRNTAKIISAAGILILIILILSGASLYTESIFYPVALLCLLAIIVIFEIDTPIHTSRPLSEAHPKESSGSEISTSCMGIAASVLILIILGLVIAPNFLGTRCPGQATACKSNLKNIGIALEMYSSDNSGYFPPAIYYITPNYIRLIPTCPSARAVTYIYTVGINYKSYTVFCSGYNHKSIQLPPNYPKYDSIQGLIDNP